MISVLGFDIGQNVVPVQALYLLATPAQQLDVFSNVPSIPTWPHSHLSPDPRRLSLISPGVRLVYSGAPSFSNGRTHPVKLLGDHKQVIMIFAPRTNKLRELQEAIRNNKHHPFFPHAHVSQHAHNHSFCRTSAPPETRRRSGPTHLIGNRTVLNCSSDDRLPELWDPTTRPSRSAGSRF